LDWLYTNDLIAYSTNFDILLKKENLINYHDGKSDSRFHQIELDYLNDANNFILHFVWILFNLAKNWAVSVILIIKD
jgi:hypothetical protein